MKKRIHQIKKKKKKKKKKNKKTKNKIKILQFHIVQLLSRLVYNSLYLYLFIYYNFDIFLVKINDA